MVETRFDMPDFTSVTGPIKCTVACPSCGAASGEPCVMANADGIHLLEAYHFTRMGWPRGGPEYGPNRN